MVFKTDLIKIQNTQIRKNVKKLKYAKTIKTYKILTQIHLNYKFKNILFKNISNSWIV